MEQPSRDDIRIGENEWITFNQLDWRTVKGVDLDPLLEPVMDFLLRLETICVAACCGLDAFCFYPEVIRREAADFDVADLLASFELVIETVYGSEAVAYRSTRLNNSIEKRTLVSLLHHIVESLQGIRVA